MTWKNVAGVAIVIAIIGLAVMLGVYGDWLWFGSVGYQSVFLKVILTAVGVGIVAFLAFAAITLANVRFALRMRPRKSRRNDSAKVLTVLCVVFSLIAGIITAGGWETVLKFLNHAPFGAADPVFGMDVGFYAFTLPFYGMVINVLLGAFILSALLSVLSYITSMMNVRFEESKKQPEFVGPIEVHSGPRMKMSWKGSWSKALPHISFLLFVIFALISASIWLAQYGVLFGSSGSFYGAGFTSINITIPLLNILAVIALVIGIMFLVNIRMKKPKFIRDGISAFIIIMVLGFLVSGAVQALVVTPNEFNTERPYIEWNIQSTLQAYGLDDADESMFTVDYNLTSGDIAGNDATVGNIRLWDWRPLKQTYQQLQLFRTYYAFNDIDIDRYDIDGSYKQVMISPREMNTQELPSQAQTWVNRHLVFTHGYGVVMNPVDKVTSEGLPIFYIKDIPPVSDKIELVQPQIYYGELTDNYVITGTSTDELDYPSGDENINTPYAGTGGVELSDVLGRVAYAVKFSSIELLVSGSIQPESRILLNRDITRRVSEIAPFLSYDPDPYIVISEGRLFWILDAYTTTSMYPYSEPVWAPSLGGEFNYIRNSVKVVVDAYNGDVDYYVIDDSDPMIQAYSGMFPGIFKPFESMPEGLKSHIRYPEGLFSVQAHIYSTYHMKNPSVFYNKEDVWVIPDEIYRGSREMMDPYYVIMKLPDNGTGQGEEEFMLMIPFTPKGKENLIGWMAARSDVPNYGKVKVFQFSKQLLTYGPMQIEARIDQDPEISQLITLWSQSGSAVLRGNTLVIPIEDSIIYVEPLYLEATERGTLPQLQRVIVAYGDQLTMKETLEEAIDEIFGTDTGQPGSGDGDDGGDGQLPQTDLEKLQRIAELYDLAQEALGEGNLGLYQSYVEMIGELAG